MILARPREERRGREIGLQELGQPGVEKRPADRDPKIEDQAALRLVVRHGVTPFDETIVEWARVRQGQWAINTGIGASERMCWVNPPKTHSRNRA